MADDVQGGELQTRQGWVPAGVLQEKQSLERDQTSLAARRQAVVRELVETEEEFGRDMQQVVSRYMRPMDKATTPAPVVLLEGIKYYAGEPRMLGRALLRMEREFDKHRPFHKNRPITMCLCSKG
ncbi:Muscle M-line assembly protein unc-89 [Operophtera brumata]|uniref:Muscle M-line assembly protein unc-89 n=1 Tax=Operophtera brumata TaxID=104452 RepID=A0A0L7L0N4_OPEBR|nr:Muscle M-line assembly protein unc-89 [Operophtera brumata]